MKINIRSPDGRVVPLDLDPSEPIENVAAIIEAETSIPMDQQVYTNGSWPLIITSTSAKLSSLGLKEGDTVTVARRSAPTAAAAAAGGGGGRSTSSVGSGSGAAATAAGGLDLAGALFAAGGGGGRFGRKPKAPKGPAIDPALYPSLSWDDVDGNPRVAPGALL